MKEAHLVSSGWSAAEISHLREHFTPRKEAQLLALLGACLVGLAALVVPYGFGILGELLTDSALLFSLALLGVPLGAAFGFLLMDFERFDKPHHVGILVGFPLLVLIGGTLLFRRGADTVPAEIFPHNPLLASAVYAFAFIAPYAYLVRHEWNSRIGPSLT